MLTAFVVVVELLLELLPHAAIRSTVPPISAATPRLRRHRLID
jgi:hypothetical protein